MDVYLEEKNAIRILKQLSDAKKNFLGLARSLQVKIKYDQSKKINKKIMRLNHVGLVCIYVSINAHGRRVIDSNYSVTD